MNFYLLLELFFSQHHSFHRTRDNTNINLRGGGSEIDSSLLKLLAVNYSLKFPQPTSLKSNYFYFSKTIYQYIRSYLIRC